MKRRGAARQVVLHVALLDIAPLIWRRVRVPETFSLHQLHRTFQVIFSWLDYHLYSFDIRNQSFEAPHEEATGEDATAVSLVDLKLQIRDRFTYTYDFGDDWRHEVRVEEFLPMPGPSDPDWSPRLLAGARAAPPEDAGGPFGYATMLEALAQPDHPEHEEFRAWLPPDYDPAVFDRWALDHALSLATAWGAV